MSLLNIIAMARVRLDDEKGSDTKRFWKDWELVQYANEIQADIARQLYCLHAKDLIGSIEIVGSAGQIDSVSVSGITISSASVAYSNSPTTTAVNLAANINAYTSTPNYRASSRGPHVLIKAVPGTGYPAAGYTVTPVTSGGLTAEATLYPGLCRNIVSVGERYLPLHENVIAITRFKPSSQSRPISGTTKELLDVNISGWEDASNGTISTWAPDYDNKDIILYPPSDEVELIEQDCTHLPLFVLSEDEIDVLLEIDEKKYNYAMVDGIISMAFTKNDVEETMDMPKSRKYEEKYNAKIEAWKIERIRNTPNVRTNQTPSGLM